MARPRKFDEDRVLEVARDEFWATGYGAARIDTIADATGLGKGSLYGAFGSKSKLYYRVFAKYCADIVEATRQALAGPDNEAFTRLSAHMMRVATETGADTVRRGCFLAKGSAELTEHDREIASCAREAMSALLTLLHDNIAGAQRNGDIAADCDPTALAAMMLAVMRGIEAVGKAGITGDVLKTIAATAIASLPKP